MRSNRSAASPVRVRASADARAWTRSFSCRSCRSPPRRDGLHQDVLGGEERNLGLEPPPRDLRVDDEAAERRSRGGSGSRRSPGTPRAPRCACWPSRRACARATGWRRSSPCRASRAITWRASEQIRSARIGLRLYGMARSRPARPRTAPRARLRAGGGAGRCRSCAPTARARRARGRRGRPACASTSGPRPSSGARSRRAWRARGRAPRPSPSRRRRAGGTRPACPSRPWPRGTAARGRPPGLLQVHHEVRSPERRPLADGRRLRRLKVGVARAPGGPGAASAKSPSFRSVATSRRSTSARPLAHLDQVGVVRHVRGRRAPVDDRPGPPAPRRRRRARGP